MKKFLLLLSVNVVVTLAVAAAKPTFQDDLAEQLKNDTSYIFVRNDSQQAVEINKEQIGKDMLCLTRDNRKLFLQKVVKEMFKKGQPTALVRCDDGRLDVGEGYI